MQDKSLRWREGVLDEDYAGDCVLYEKRDVVKNCLLQDDVF